MALTSAEKQRRYRERHVMIKRDTLTAIAPDPQASTSTPAVAPDLTAVRAALAEARHVLSNHNPYNATMARQIQSVMTVLEKLVEALGPHRA